MRATQPCSQPASQPRPLLAHRTLIAFFQIMKMYRVSKEDWTQETK